MTSLATQQDAMRTPDADEGKDFHPFRPAATANQTVFSTSEFNGKKLGSAFRAFLWSCAGIFSGGLLTAIYFLHGLMPSISVAALLLMIMLTFLGLTRLGEETDLFLRNREHYYRDFFENAVEGVFRTTPDGHYLSVNRALARILGYQDKASLLGENGGISPDLYVCPQRRADFQHKIAEQGEVSNFVSEIRRPDGSTAWVSENARVVSDKYGRIVCYEGTIEDITAKIRAERMMAEALHKAEEANRAKSAFLATMSHELRTPLNAIIGFSEIIKREMLGPMMPLSYRDYAGDIYTSGIHLLAIINDILDASRLEGGNIALDLQPHAIDKLIEDGLHLARQLHSEPRDIIIANAPDLPKLIVDGKRLSECIAKLITNAMKFTPKSGAITVRAEIGANNGLNLSVIDTGIGMQPDCIAEVLQPFYQIDGSIARRFDGTGLGLPITKALVELHGGTLHIRSALGEGTVVTISLPPTCTQLGQPHSQIKSHSTVI